jgi:hypothetical protein
VKYVQVPDRKRRNEMLTIIGIALLITAGVVGLGLLGYVSRWYIAYWLASFDFIFTEVSEGYFKEVVRFRGHKATLLTKEGYKIEDAPGDTNGDIVKLLPGEPPESSLPGGLRVVGWPLLDRVYKRNMRFTKSMPNGKTKDYNVEKEDEFYALVDYPYALPFTDCEDKNNLPISGHATLLACVVGPKKSLFGTANFYDTMVGLVLPVVQECYKQRFSFDEKKKKQDIDEMMWAELNEPGPTGVSVIDELYTKYRIRIVAYRTVALDPPEEYRKLSLTKWTADRRAEAAKSVKKAEAIEAAGPIDYSMDEWIKKEAREHEETVAEAKTRLRKSGEYKEHRKLLADQINRKRGTVHETKVDMLSGGEPLQEGSLASVVGTIASGVIGAWEAKKTKGDSDSGDKPGKASGKKRGRKGAEPRTLDDIDDDDDTPL